MSRFLVSPTEEDLLSILKDDAVSSSLPESRGADVLMLINHEHMGVVSVGVQRKRVPTDWVLSIRDGRLQRELSLLKACTFRFLVPEGPFLYNNSGNLRGPNSHTYSFTEESVRALHLSVRFVHGVDVEPSDGLSDTVSVLNTLHSYFSSSKHTSTLARPKLKGLWGVPGKRELQSWLLQGFPGLGVSMAGRILGHFGNCPLKWSCTMEELMEVPKVGEATARKWLEAVE